MNPIIKSLIIALVCAIILTYFTIADDGKRLILTIYACVFVYAILLPLLLKSEKNKERAFMISGASVLFTLLLSIPSISIAYYFNRQSKSLFDAFAEVFPTILSSALIYLIPMVPVILVITLITYLVQRRLSKSKD